MKYSLFYHKVDANSDIKSFLSAGIVVKNDNGIEIKRIYDVSTDFTALEKLVLSLNTDKIELEDLDSVLDNYYSQHF